MDYTVGLKLDKDITSGQIEETRQILKNHAEVNHPQVGLGKRYGSWLFMAACTDNVQMVQMLVEEFGFDVNAPASEECSAGPIDEAARKGCLSVARWLLEHGANVNVGGKGYATPLASAASFGHLEIVRLLLERGADPNVIFGTMEYGDPPTNALKQAIMLGHQEVAQLLREHGAVLPPGQEEFGKPPSGSNGLLDHIERFLGKPEPLSLREIVPGDPPIVIHVVLMENKLALVTAGMSNKPLSVPAGGEDFQFAELVMYLPRDWPLSETALRDPNHFWPIAWLRRIAHYPHDNRTWLGGRATIIANDEPPRPLAPNTKMTCLLAIVEASDFGWAQLADGRRVAFYHLFPLYTEERKIEVEQGMEQLLRLLHESGISTVVDIQRANVACI